MPYCHSPWTNLDIDPQGQMAPCCKFDYSQYNDNSLNINDNSINDYLNSKVLLQSKEEFENNRWPAGCIRCKVEEESNVQSKRQLDYERWQDQYDNYAKEQKFITASVAFGNTCNLKCIICGPGSSSKWHTEAQAITGITKKPNHFYKQNFVQDVIQNLPNLTHLDIPGGEPFLSGIKQQKELLDYYIQSDQAKHISIHYTTNTQIYPDQSWWDLWEHFKEVDIQISVDGIESRYEYIRFPGDWIAFEQNTKKYLEAAEQKDNIKLSVSHTLSAYNIYYLDEFFTWCQNIGLPRPWVGRIHRPEHMRASVFPQTIKQQIVAHLNTSNFNDVKTWANHLSVTDDSKYFDLFCNRKKLHDHYRSLSFDKTFPEVAELLANY